ncbi:hypothetical protein VTL71DRAFT_4399 [Oculimacula yallundae]|uniref:MYND-type domain-containing protein n=1 Tax=Oculimacula yallundae TaxID=86028 RepID=A0ABR4C1Y1_9HELO
MSPSAFLTPCANWTYEKSACDKQGISTCGNCKLVVYCDSACQKAHWTEHKKACRSPMGKKNWRPAWDREGRIPHWASSEASTNLHNVFGGSKYLWGNTPAVDVLRLERNEGVKYQEDIALLFAASGDLRHVVKTIASLPHDMEQRFDVTLNDLEFDVVARNAILLLLALTIPDSTDVEASIIPLSNAEVLIHVWYSASFPKYVLSQLQDRVKPLITEVCSKITGKPAKTTLGKTWTFSNGRTLRLVLKQEDWLRLAEFLEVPAHFSLDDAAAVRRIVTLAPERLDYRDRWYFKESSPSMRIARQKFQEDGILLPFGHPRTAFDTPNPTFFQGQKRWPQDDKADPSSGWPVLDVQQTSTPAAQDWYGKLFIYIHDMIEKFLDRLRRTKLCFVLYNVDVRELPQHLGQDRYDRIEVANICDGGYIGIRNTLSLLSPFLKSPQQNVHATLITLFINAVKETVKRGDPKDETPNMRFLMKYLPLPRTPSMNDADMLRIWDARDLALDVDRFFNRYMIFYNFKQISADLGVEMKESNTIVEEWPTQLKLKIGEKGAEEEFRLCLGSYSVSIERYVEWSRVS